MRTHVVEGKAAKFRINWDDSETMKALDRLGYEGPRTLRAFIHNKAEEAVEQVKISLKKFAGPAANVVVPAGGGYGPSKNIYTRVGDSLKVVAEPGTTFFRVGSEPFPDGVRGQRGGKIAAIVSGGMKSFTYPTGAGKLPNFVRSSTSYYMKGNKSVDSSVLMKNKRRHPGFKKTYDFIGETAQVMNENYQKQIDERLEFLMKASGFVKSRGYGI